MKILKNDNNDIVMTINERQYALLTDLIHKTQLKAEKKGYIKEPISKEMSEKMIAFLDEI